MHYSLLDGQHSLVVSRKQASSAAKVVWAPRLVVRCLCRATGACDVVDRSAIMLYRLAEFCVQLFIFAEHSALHPGGKPMLCFIVLRLCSPQSQGAVEIVHIVRGVSMGCCMLLFLLNFIPVDQEAYEEIKLDASTELSYGSLEDDKQGSEQVEDDPDRVPPAARSRMMRSLSSLSQALFGDKELSSMSLDKDSERTPLLS